MFSTNNNEAKEIQYAKQLWLIFAISVRKLIYS